MLLFAEMSRAVKSLFPTDYKRRRAIEKRRRHQLPPLPGTRALPPRHGRPGNSAHFLAAGAGVCFVVMLMMLGFTVFATTIGLVLWYLVEVAMDLLCELAVEVNDFISMAYQALVLTCVDGRVPEELAQHITASALRMITAFTRLMNRTQQVTGEEDEGYVEKNAVDDSSDTGNSTNDSSQFLMHIVHAQRANYVLVGFLVTYLLYRFARHIQAERQQA